MRVGAILLAAGSARRMGEDKLLADLAGRPLLLHALAAIETAGLEGPVIAVAPRSPILSLLKGRGGVVEVADHAAGMGHSLAAAAAVAPSDWDAAVICLGDMPFVRSATLKMLADAASRDAVIRPIYQGQAGNPVLWGCDHFAALAHLRGDSGGRDLLASLSVRRLDCGDPGVTLDIDTPDALAAARARLLGGG